MWVWTSLVAICASAGLLLVASFRADNTTESWHAGIQTSLCMCPFWSFSSVCRAANWFFCENNIKKMYFGQAATMKGSPMGFFYFPIHWPWLHRAFHAGITINRTLTCPHADKRKDTRQILHFVYFDVPCWTSQSCLCVLAPSCPAGQPGQPMSPCHHSTIKIWINRTKKVSYKMERVCRGATTGVQLVQFPHFCFRWAHSRTTIHFWSVFLPFWFFLQGSLYWPSFQNLDLLFQCSLNHPKQFRLGDVYGGSI